ncbi:3-hydroxyacyl-CoA dehydrogenase [Pseudomonas chlororaphis]|uniref:3-hydroxyacyl-CoA dehydrogenase n=1 Tax=Pseudomonas chlororaphis TaxID=587753 RepID=UPI00087B73B4|nr:3-hydroxyacyl-CoA dehydrogenase [Pseudomonas chlororaphis]AZD64239.1 Enoyl-CoA hydratase [Pseudomonas chlororaphis subsp. aurantiaca]AZD76910.1 Enoyl-CoA hydratase [Pseudomonas chlororaphis subsp. aurantiaca]QIT20451.1 3-hydroxyacyl-CoA dehydrogenase [Pseudomonas chlororaphis subsp. aurantiaca]WDH04598.1 3-hydroxyacyl-CoA dehydrogenase NAD-binding domain-containing protein [Pseudomonas chlororaphis]WDH12647.1 3-hydroxyacyl-CoA dehydrogenase NAD-binding domain-containing protein [Pseudomonas
MSQIEIQRAAVIGAGTMGRGIVMCLANAGVAVQWVDNNPQMLEQALTAVTETYAHNVRQGRIDQAEADARRARVSAAVDYLAIRDVDLVIEAVYENLELKQNIFRELDGLLQPRAILASNTSALDIDAIAAVTRRPRQVLGLHFFSPAHIMKLLEIVRGAATAPLVLEAALALGERMGKVSVVSGNCPGFIGNRMLRTYVLEARKMLLEGAFPYQVDAALQGFGFAMGPFRMYDVVGIDLEWRARQLAGKGQEAHEVQVDNRLCEAGRFGQKSGNGYYHYEPGSRQAEHDAQVDALVQEVSEGLGYRRRDVGPEEILERCLLALVNEGAKILEEGIAGSAQDIDLVYLNGYGFPADKGGPMSWADRQGLVSIQQGLLRLQAELGAHWKPARLIDELVQAGKGFADHRAIG